MTTLLTLAVRIVLSNSSISRKPPRRLLHTCVLWGLVSWKIASVLAKLYKSLLENHSCRYIIQQTIYNSNLYNSKLLITGIDFPVPLIGMPSSANYSPKLERISIPRALSSHREPTVYLSPYVFSQDIGKMFLIFSFLLENMF